MHKRHDNEASNVINKNAISSDFKCDFKCGNILGLVMVSKLNGLSVFD